MWIHLFLYFGIKHQSLILAFQVPDITKDNYYGMGVEDAWMEGYTGEGVVIGITDVGVDTDLLELKDNINTIWSYNFVRNNTIVTAEHFHDHPETKRITNHGNNVASIIGAVKDNDICSSGIAFRSTIVVLKVFEFIYTVALEITPNDMLVADVTARALIHRLDDVHILVLSWTLNRSFGRLNSATITAFSQGVKLGRKGLGRIYVVAAGPIGNELSNNINTITVNGMGRHGTIPTKAYRDTSVLTSGLVEGYNITSEYMFTSNINDECTVGFSGVSAATSQIAAIVAQALQANPKLSARNIQHLIVRSCHISGMNESYAFRRNGAGRFYHPYFGFGLLNATTLTRNAKTFHMAEKLLSLKLEAIDECTSDEGVTLRYNFCQNCKSTNDFSCITVTEHVVMAIDIQTNATNLSIMLTSPSGTRSLFLENAEVTNGNISGKLVSANFWDESALGEWKLKISGNGVLQIDMTKVSLELYGTNRKHRFNRECRCNRKNEQEDHESSDYLSRSSYMLSMFGAITIALGLSWKFR